MERRSRVAEEDLPWVSRACVARQTRQGVASAVSPVPEGRLMRYTQISPWWSRDAQDPASSEASLHHYEVGP